MHYQNNLIMSGHDPRRWKRNLDNWHTSYEKHGYHIIIIINLLNVGFTIELLKKLIYTNHIWESFIKSKEEDKKNDKIGNIWIDLVKT